MKSILTKTAFAAFIALLAGCATQNPQADSESAGWIQWRKSAGGNGHYYKAVCTTTAISWTEADLLARAQAGYLATITSAEENAFLAKLIDDPKFFIAIGAVPLGYGPAIGGFQKPGSREPDGGWCWVSGEPWKFSNWYPPSEPDNYSGVEDRLQFCSGAVGKPAATWNDTEGIAKWCSGYVVERDR